MTRSGILFVLLLMVLPCAVQALVTESGERVLFERPVNDDVFAAGGKVMVNAPVQSLIAAGGEIEINAPVEGDVIAAGGTITINAPVRGKVVLAGGLVTLNGSIGRNVLIHAGDVKITEGTTVGADALISASQVSNMGDVEGNLTVSSHEFTHTGTASHLSYTRESSSLGEGLLGFLSLAMLLFSAGMGILGLLLIRLAPGPYQLVEGEVRSRPLLKGLAGLGGILGGIILAVLLTITLIGLPVAICVIMGLVSGLLFATLCVSSSLGKVIGDRFGWSMKTWQHFLLGFVILQLGFRIPFLGLVILVICLCLGFGALLYALPSCRGLLSGREEEVGR
ncbi:MAG: hypothetical protein MUC66_01025 [Methanolinea sp.]|jgi:hypothetical protein|nr:hypothetical protein [Methanolinea sp.]